MKAAIYLRVSTVQQDGNNQLPELAALCKARGWHLEVFTETESGAKARPVLDKLCDDACRGRFQAVAVWALDRLGRNLWDVTARVRRLQVANVRLVSLREPWLEQEGPARELLLFIFAWVAEQERRRLVERTHAGLAKARAAGRVGGRPRVDATALALALADYEALPDWQKHGRGKHGPGIAHLARFRGIGEGTLRRAIDAKKGPRSATALPSEKKRSGRDA